MSCCHPPIPLLLAQPSEQGCRRWELSRAEALKLWAEKRQQGWKPCEPQWKPPPPKPT